MNVFLVWPIEELLCSPGKVTGVTDLVHEATLRFTGCYSSRTADSIKAGPPTSARFVELNPSRARKRTTPMIETAAKQQLLNDIEKLDQHSVHEPINIIRCCIDPRRWITDKPAEHKKK